MKCLENHAAKCCYYISTNIVFEYIVSVNSNDIDDKDFRRFPSISNNRIKSFSIVEVRLIVESTINISTYL